MPDHDMTCGECGATWNDKETPTPAARCPYEYEHDHSEEIEEMARKARVTPSGIEE